MTRYRYATVLEAQNDGKPPNDNIEKGDKIVRAGKHEEDNIQYMTEDNDLAVVEYEAIEVYEANDVMDEREAQEFAKDQWFAQQDND